MVTIKTAKLITKNMDTVSVSSENNKIYVLIGKFPHEYNSRKIDATSMSSRELIETINNIII